MDDFRKYILSVVSAAMICSIVMNLSVRAGKSSGLINIVCGLFLATTVLMPIMNIELPDYYFRIQSIYETANHISQKASDTARENMASIIKEKTRTYILEKASSLNMDIDVEVNLDDEDLTPVGVVVTGTVSPYERTLLLDYIHKSLDIPEEQQQWKEK